MLSVQETKLNFIFFYICSKLNFLPIAVNRQTLKIQRQPSKLRRGNWYLNLFVAVLYYFYVHFRFVQGFLYPEYFVKRHISIHFSYVCGTTLSTWWLIACFVLWPDLNIALFNYIYDDEDMFKGTSSSDESRFKRSSPGPRRHFKIRRSQDKEKQYQKCRSLLELSLQEKLAIALPAFLFGIVGSLILLLLVDSTRIHLVYFIVSPEYRNNWTLFVFILVEIYVLVIYFAGLSFVLFIHLSLLDKVSFAVDKEIIKIRDDKSTETVTAIRQLYSPYRKCRHLQIAIHLLNQSHCNVIFVFKIFCITLPISLIYYSFDLMSMYAIDAAINLTISFQSMTMFVVVYDRAFSIPGKIEQLKTEIQIALVLRTGERTTSRCMDLAAKMKTMSHHLKRQLLAIANVGIKVGGFHTFERISTMIFLDFITSKIAGLLVAFR